jgi:hypothetical protein
MDLTLIQAHLTSVTSPGPVEQTPVETETLPTPKGPTAADVAEIVCDPTVTLGNRKVVVQAQPDGAHVAVTNTLDRPIRVAFEFAQEEARIEARAQREFVVDQPPGPAGAVICSDPEDGTKIDYFDLEVVDPEGLYQPFPLECRDDTRGETVLDYAGGARGEADPVVAARKYVGILEHDSLELAGYPEREPPVVAVTRDGRVVARLFFRSDGYGGWLLEGTVSCGDVGI